MVDIQAGQNLPVESDPEVVRHQQIWEGFSGFVKWGTIGVAILMVFMFLFVF